LERPKEKVVRIFCTNPDMKPSQVQSTAILHDIRQRKPWEDIKKTAKSFGDKISNQKQKVKSETKPFGHNFEAVAAYKEYCDKKDPFYIYKINDKRGNPDKPSFVFKSSKLGAKFAQDMVEEGHILHEEFCCFDGKVNRCKGLVTVTASVYHPILRKQLVLASMECESESTETVTQFWSLFNEMLRKTTGQAEFMFSPRGWCSDMAGSNLQGIQKVFGEEALQKVKGCEFHFKDCRNRHARKLHTQESKDRFKKLCDALLAAATPSAYNCAKENLTIFIDEASEEREHLAAWVKWWDDRRGFIFPAFAPWNGAPRMNQAEVVHASWAHKDRENMTLLDAAECHVRDSVLLETEYESIKNGDGRVGTGPSVMHRRAQQTAIQMRRATTLGEELLREDITISDSEPRHQGREVNPHSTHRADKSKENKYAGTSRFRSTRSTHFQSRIQYAKQDKDIIKVAKILSRSRLSAVFEIASSRCQKVHKVEISKTPECTCDDYQKFNGKELCKHIIWIYVYVLQVDEISPLIQQITLSEDALTEILKDSFTVPKNHILDRSKSSSFGSRLQRIKSILTADRRNNQQLSWYLTHKEQKPGKNPHCKASKCKKEILPGDLCVCVIGLEVPYEQDFAIQSNFYFCPHQECIQQVPPWSNLTIPDQISIKEDVSDAEVAGSLRKGLRLSF
jgi:hypothetical protein